MELTDEARDPQYVADVSEELRGQDLSAAAGRRLAVQGVLGWVGAAVAWSLLTASGHHSGSYVARVAMSILLGGLATSGLVYLIVEWTIRPIIARAFADSVPERMLAPGVRTKLIA